jgi:hypothetical protein
MTVYVGFLVDGQIDDVRRLRSHVGASVRSPRLQGRFRRQQFPQSGIARDA